MSKYSGNIIADLIDEQREREVMVEVECPDCEGDKVIRYLSCGGTKCKIKCPTCNGTGRIIKISESEAKENAEIRAGELKEDR